MSFKLDVVVEETDYYNSLWDFWTDIKSISGGAILGNYGNPRSFDYFDDFDEIYSGNIIISHNTVIEKDKIVIVLKFITESKYGGIEYTKVDPIEIRKENQNALFVKFMVGLTHRLIYKHTNLYGQI